MSTDALSFADFDDPPEKDTLAVDNGLELHDYAAAPLSDVRPLGSFANNPAGQVVGGAVGRTWGSCCELLQLWVEPTYRTRGVASRLLQQFERRAASRGCNVFYLTTLSYQAPEFYRNRGYTSVAEISGYPNGITKYVMYKAALNPSLEPTFTGKPVSAANVKQQVASTRQPKEIEDPTMRVEAHVENEHQRHTVELRTNGSRHSLHAPLRSSGFGSSASGGELLCLAAATCYCNDIYREAEKRNIVVVRVEVDVSAEFGAVGEPARSLSYQAKVAARASESEIRDLMLHTDQVAEIQNTLRRGMEVQFDASVVESSA